MSKADLIFDKVCEFMNEHNVECAEDVFQRGRNDVR